MEKMLDKISCPQDIRKLSMGDLEKLAIEIRAFLITSISQTGGHIGANLGVVELTIALHHVFEIEKDKIVFDTGHQGYTHKILTGRKDDFKTLNQYGGMSRFISRAESLYDTIDASHAGTAISIAIGLALSNKQDCSESITIAFVGDGSLVEGMSFEGLNFGTALKLPLIIVINDNGMAIPPNVGGIKKLFTGNDSLEKAEAFFSGLGYNYVGVSDGHNLSNLVSAFTQARSFVKKGTTIVHVKTEKGKGLEIAKTHPYKMHFSMPFNPQTGEGASSTPDGKTYAVVAGNKLYSLLKENHDITILTPSTPYASGLDRCLSEFPDKTIDVGMAEQHALGMACGLALNNRTVFVCYQSTFMQRTLDQIIHDAGFMNLPVTIIAARSGFSGFDSHTHHGIYDISYLRAIPNLSIFYPGTSRDLEKIIEERSISAKGPMIILHPYELVRTNEMDFYSASDSINGIEIIGEGRDGFILSVGNTLETSIDVRDRLLKLGIEFGLANVRWLKPLPEKQIFQILSKTNRIVTTEENVIEGGFGSSIAELILDNEFSCTLLRNAIPNGFVRPGDKQHLSRLTKIDADSLMHKIKIKWKDLF